MSAFCWRLTKSATHAPFRNVIHPVFKLFVTLTAPARTMVRHYKRKIASLPHARKDRKFYLDVFRHNFTGHSPARIADYLSTSRPTVHRALKRLRPILLNNADAHRCILKHAVELKVQSLGAHEDNALELWAMGHKEKGYSIREYDWCMRRCPLKENPVKFSQRFLSYYSFNYEDYAINQPSINDYNALFSYLQKCRDCTVCPLRKARSTMHRFYQFDYELYARIIMHLSKYRLGKYDDLELQLIYLEANSFSFFTEIISTFMGRVQNRFLSAKEERIEILAFFLSFTEELFETVERQIVSHNVIE